MSTFVTLIIVFIVFVLIKFAFANNEQGNKVQSEGGMRVKYATLIHHILVGDKNARIIDEGRTHITIGQKSMTGTVIIDIVQTFGSVTIVWELDNAIFGKHRKEFEFSENMSQDIMFKRIEAELSAYQQTILSKHIS